MEYVSGRLSNPWIGAAIAAGAAWYVATKMPEKVQMLPERIREPNTLAVTAFAAVFAIHMLWFKHTIQSPVKAVTEIVSPPAAVPAFPPRGLLGAEAFYS